MKTIKENESYELEMSDIINYLEDPNLEPCDIDIEANNWLCARIAHKFCEQNLKGGADIVSIDRDYAYSSYSTIEIIRVDGDLVNFQVPREFEKWNVGVAARASLNTNFFHTSELKKEIKKLTQQTK